jgi:Protein of unknown function (DUF1153)
MTKRVIDAHTAHSLKSIGEVAVMVDNIDLTKLPPPDTNRWVVSRKAAVVHAVRDGSISLREACQRYTLSIEEFLAWERAVDRYGIPGLRYPNTDLPRYGQGACGAGEPRERSIAEHGCRRVIMKQLPSRRTRVSS